MSNEEALRVLETELELAALRLAPLLAALSDADSVRAAMRLEFELALLRAAARVPEPMCGALLGLGNPDV